METSGPGIKPVDNESESRASRTTREGKKFTYRLHVLQEPLRARACGAGAKSSADRRPVDPPPIVELQIFDENDRDVTFSMNANYFLFTTLEQARQIAPSRGMAHDGKNQTVLTGTPVAGMVCLDRPKPAGYFIFPDLSVRHEGSYRLSFSLYEELKEAKDEDQSEDLPRANSACGVHVTHRLEVKSKPFTVFSAKKFPGLTESTSLSRMVAEQGCRVRIRRDVRMRKRESKNGKEWEGYEDQTAEARSRMSATPEASAYSGMPTPHGYIDSVPRPRSGSNASHHSLAPSLSRRPSAQEMSQGYHASAYGTAPHTPQTGYSQPSPYGPSPGQFYTQTSYAQQQSSMQPPLPQYPQQAYQPPPSQPVQQSHYGYSAGPPLRESMIQNSYSAHHPPPPPPPPAPYEQQEHAHRPSMEFPSNFSHDHRRSSNNYTVQPPPALTQGYQRHQSFQAHNGQPSYPTGNPLPPQNAVYTQQPTPQQPTQQQSTGMFDNYAPRPAPLEPVQPPTRPTGATTPFRTSSFTTQLPPLNTVTSRHLEPSSPMSATPHSGYYTTSAHSQLDPHKRSYGQVFNDRHLSQPLRHGARPSSPGQSFYATTEVDDNEPDHPALEGQEVMKYRRSDGRHMERPLQPQN